ncbi:hypothetical protein KUG47_08320 [Falsochrobactrum sp. TDYN1]|uniref:Lipoprotein n=1 Tax=Falsochrobactrum tianjinense TaxID=2706015 RepID=A0A949PP69_9HYPH|nr:hypothetical protein [Falsochrobactrum sp. TDYN1]MBV2143501.1 hypothetical protein [Falsochrobactrum sp. TDYN1]
MKRKTLVSLVPILVLSGCLNIPGNLPANEFTFNASNSSTKKAIIKTFRSRNYRIVRDSKSQLVMDRPAKDSVRARLIYGSKRNTVPNARVLLTITGNKPTKVNSMAQIVTNPGSRSERITDVSQNAEAREAIARGMDQVKKQLDKK